MSKFPSVPVESFQDPEVRELARIVKELSKITRGRVTATVPTATTCAEGEIILYASGAIRRLYTKLNGTIRHATLT